MTRALLLIDIQTGLDNPGWGARNNPDAESNAARLIAHFRAAGAPVIHICHISTNPDSPLAPDAGGTGFKPEAMPDPGEAVFEKSVNSAFIGTGLEAHLRDTGIDSLVICGLTTPHCVSTTCRMGANLGFDVTLAHDACAAFADNADTGWHAGLPAMSADDVHAGAVSHLHGEFVNARTTDDILTEPA